MFGINASRDNPDAVIGNTADVRTQRKDDNGSGAPVSNSGTCYVNERDNSVTKAENMHAASGVLKEMFHEMNPLVRSFVAILHSLAHGKGSEDKVELRKWVSILKYMVEHPKLISKDVKRVYSQSRLKIIKFFIKSAEKRGYPRWISGGYIRRKLSEDVKDGIEGLYDLLKRGLKN